MEIRLLENVKCMLVKIQSLLKLEISMLHLRSQDTALLEVIHTCIITENQ